MSTPKSDKVNLAISDLEPPAPYLLLTSGIVPRPIAWVSSRSETGVDNLAPHSFVTVASVVPPVLLFTSVGEKDTVRNVRATGEFVVNMATEELIDQVNQTSGPYPAEVSEFDAAGLTREPAATISVARVAESPVAFECRLRTILEVGNSFVVLGDVVSIAVNPDVCDGLTHVDFAAAAPVGKLGRDEWVHPGAVSSRPRPSAADIAASQEN